MAELAAALDNGTLAPGDADLGDLVGRVRAATPDIEGSSLAVQMLARAIAAKVRLLLPVEAVPEEPAEEDSSAEGEDGLAARLAAYGAFAEAREVLRGLERTRMVRHGRPPEASRREADGPPALRPETLDRLLEAFGAVWERASARTAEVERDGATVAAALAQLRSRLVASGEVAFEALFPEDASRAAVVVTFLALLELVRLGEARVSQDQPFGHLRIVAGGGRQRGSVGDGQ